MTRTTRAGIGIYAGLIVILMALGAVVLVLGGGYLLTLGGSPYYVIAGLFYLIAAVLFVSRQAPAALIVAGMAILTALWAWWETGGDGWDMLPRLTAPLLLCLLLSFAIPRFRRLHETSGGALMALPLAFVVGLAIWGAAFAVGAQEGQSATADVGQREVETVSLAGVSETEWRAYGGTNSATRYTTLDQITPENVEQLELVWEYHTGDMPSEEAGNSYSPENTPLVVNDTVYVCSAMGIVSAVDPGTGQERWRYDPAVAPQSIPYGATCRGVAYVDGSTQTAAGDVPEDGDVPDDGNATAEDETPVVADDDLCATSIIWGTLDARLLAIDAATGEPCPRFGSAGSVNLLEGLGETVPGWYAMTSPPTIVNGIAVVGAQVKDGQAEDAPSGVVRGYDARTGELAWAWDMGAPDRTGAPPAGETYTRGTPNMWTIAAGDDDLGLVYLPMGNSSVDYYGSNRSEAENAYSTALVAIDVATGTVAWSFQTVYNDVWDYDLGSQPTLVDFPTDGGTVRAIILASKQGDMYVLDAETGEALTGVEEREVPQGGVEPDYLSSTQPFSTWNTLAQPDLTERDMWGISLFDQLYCRIQFREASYEGIYTPPTSDTHWIQYPGYNGGSDWGSLAIDPVRGIILANYNDMPNHNRLIPREEADAAGLRAINEPGAEEVTYLGEAGPQVGAPYAIDVNAGWRVPFTGLLCSEPPYGGLRAIDLATGETLWDRPFGTARRNGPFGLPTFLPAEIGTPNNGGAVVTAGGVAFLAAATDNLFRAVDISTGETLWSVVLPAGGQANPFSFEADGRQFIGIMAGGHHFMETPVGDSVLVWALP